MNAKIAIMIMAALLVAACAVASKQMEEAWNPRLGNYTYEQAVSTYGPPAAKEVLTNSKTVATWVRGHRGTSTTVPVTNLYTGEYMYSTTVDNSYTDILTLTFDPQGVLEWWVWERN